LIKAPIELDKESIQKRLCSVTIRSFLVKAAVRANPGTERNMNIEMAQSVRIFDSVQDLHKDDIVESCSENP
jgi:hypothetical protein